MTRSRRVLHLSDTHLTGSGIDMDGVDAREALTGLLHDLRHLGRLDLVVTTGDLADDGSVAGVAMARDLIGSWAASRGAPHAYTTGNHDDRTSFAQVLGSGHLSKDGADLGTRGPGCAAVSDLDGLRLVTLDSLVPGATHGVLDGDQLDWLADVLSEPAPAGTIVAFHHPPVTVASLPWVGEGVLRSPEALGSVVQGTDVRAILTGHLHHQLSGSLAGVPVWVTPGIVTRVDLTSPPDVLRAVLGAGATVVELPDAGSATFHVVRARRPDETTPVYTVDVATGGDVPDV